MSISGVIPAQAGTQGYRMELRAARVAPDALDSRLRGNDEDQQGRA